MWRERGRFSPQKDQTGRKKQTKSNRALGPQNDSKEKKRPAMEKERSCCRGENVIKYPSSWENALASAGLGNGFIPVLPQGGRNRVYRYSRAGAHPRVASLGLCPIHLLQGHPHPPQCAHWGTFPLEGGRLGGRLIAAPTKWVETCPLIRLAFARHLPPKGKAFGRPQGSPLRRIQHQYRWFGKARRRI